MTQTIKEVQYTGEIKLVGVEGFGIECMENVITFEDDSIAVRFGITRVHGKNIKEMTASLVEVTSEDAWWSLQATSLNELKAAYRAGFRNRELSSLEQHLKAFENQCGTLHVERVEG